MNLLALSRGLLAPMTVAALAATVTLTASQAPAPKAAATPKPGDHFIALAVNPNAPIGVSASTTVDIDIDRWSTDTERDHFLTVLAEQGPDKVLTTLQSMPRVGSFRTPNSETYDVHYARRSQNADGTEQVTMVTDRNIGFWEARDQGITTDYKFTVIELRLNKAGQGEGKISVAAKIMIDKTSKTIVLENYNAAPVSLNAVKRIK